MAWHRLTNKKTGEVVVVATTDGYDLSKWEAVRLKANRAPGEFQAIADDGTVVTDKDRKASEQRRAAVRAMDPAERFQLVENRIAELEARLDKAKL